MGIGVTAVNQGGSTDEEVELNQHERERVIELMLS